MSLPLAASASASGASASRPAPRRPPRRPQIVPPAHDRGGRPPPRVVAGATTRRDGIRLVSTRTTTAIVRPRPPGRGGRPSHGNPRVVVEPATGRDGIPLMTRTSRRRARRRDARPSPRTRRRATPRMASFPRSAREARRGARARRPEGQSQNRLRRRCEELMARGASLAA